jgi:hypothetical protein
MCFNLAAIDPDLPEPSRFSGSLYNLQQIIPSLENSSKVEDECGKLAIRVIYEIILAGCFCVSVAEVVVRLAVCVLTLLPTLALKGGMELWLVTAVATLQIGLDTSLRCLVGLVTNICADRILKVEELTLCELPGFVLARA